MWFINWKSPSSENSSEIIVNILKTLASIQTSKSIKLPISILLAFPDTDEIEFKGKA